METTRTSNAHDRTSLFCEKIKTLPKESLQKFGYSIFHIREKKDTPTYKKTDFPDRDKNVLTLTYAKNSYV